MGNLLLVVAAVLAAASSAAAQSADPLVAVLAPGQEYAVLLEGLRERLAKLGYREGEDIRFMVKYSKTDSPSLASGAAELVAAKPDAILAVTPAAAIAAKRATHTIPIVFVSVGDPIESGLVASFASSKNNLTGIASYAAPLSGKRLELLKEIAPRTQKVLMIVTPMESVSRISARHTEDAARTLGMRIIRRDVANKADIENLLLEKWARMADAVSPLTSALTATYRDQMIKKINRERLPAIFNEDTLVEKGALASYGSDRTLTGIQAANLVVKVLKGAMPSDIPIEVPDKFILAVNLSTAKAIGLKIPRPVILRVDRLIE
jgi:putative ABC transport system substrate-binding protein